MQLLGSSQNLGRIEEHREPTSYMTKLESVASSAVRAADKVNASLIIVYTQTGKSGQAAATGRLAAAFMQ